MNRVFSEYKWWMLGSAGGTAGLAFAIALITHDPNEGAPAPSPAPVTAEIDEDTYAEDVSSPPLVIENETLEDIVETEAEPEPAPEIVLEFNKIIRVRNGIRISEIPKQSKH